MAVAQDLDVNGRSGSSYYSILGVSSRASNAEIRAAYRKLALKWHPDRRGREPWLLEEAKRRFQLIQEAYQVLSDEKRRALYDAGLYNPFEDDKEDVEGLHDFIQEMMSLVDTLKREEPVYSMQQLQQMFSEMVQSFASPHQSSYWYDSGTGTSRKAKRTRTEMDAPRGQVLRSH